MDTLRHTRRWLTWRYVDDSDRDRPSKVPVDPVTGFATDPTDPTRWLTYAQAREAVDRHEHLDGIGIALGDGLTGADLDGCRDPETGEIAPWAREIIDALGSYAEASPSGTGVHVLLIGRMPDGCRHKIALGGGHLEVYDGARYFTWTGAHLDGTPSTIEHRQAALDDLCSTHLTRDEPSAAPTPTPPPTNADDRDRLTAAFNAVNGSTVRDLFDGGDGGHPSRSEPDAALAAHLAFYSDGDPVTLERLMRSSTRSRAKWDEGRNGETWLGRECRRAIERHTGPWWTPGIGVDRVRVDRRLINADLGDGALLLAALIAAGVDDDDDLADVAGGVSDSTLWRWWRDLRGADLEEIARTRPTSRFVWVPRAVLLDERLTKAEKVTALQLAAYEQEDRIEVGQEAIAQRRDRERARVTEDLQALERAGHLTASRACYCKALGRRDRVNVYRWRDTFLARERGAEAAESQPISRGARRGSFHEEHVTAEVLAQERTGTVVPDAGSTREASPPADSAPIGGERSLSLPSTPLDEHRRPEITDLDELAASPDDTLTGRQFDGVRERLVALIDAGETGPELDRLTALYMREVRRGRVPTEAHEEALV